MNEFEMRGKARVDCMSYFSSAVLVPGSYISGGLFWAENENYMNSISVILWKLIRMEGALSTLENLEKELNQILSYSEYKTEEIAIYPKESVVWEKISKGDYKLSFHRYKEDAKMKLVSGKVVDSGVEKRSGLVFLRLLGIQGGPLDSRKVFEGRKKLIDIWEELTEREDIKEHLAKVRLIGSILYNLYPEGTSINPLVLKLFGYIAGFDFKSFGDSMLLSRARLFQRRKRAEELLEEIKSSDKSLWKDIVYDLKKNGISEEEFLQFLQRLEDENFLKELRKDWKEVLKRMLKEESEKFKVCFVAREHGEEGRIGYGQFHAPSKTIRLWVFYEDSLKSKVESFVEGFKKATKALKDYIGDADISIENFHPIERLIYGFNELKKIDMDKLEHADSIKLLLSLMNFACRIKGFEDYAKKQKEIVGILLLLDTDVRQEEGGYPFWDYFRFIYDFFGLPVQTLNRQTIDKIMEATKLNDRQIRKELGSLYKNLFISFFKDYKDLSFDFEGFDFHSDLTVYAILEKPSVSFCYDRSNIMDKGYRHYLYEIYRIKIKDKNAEVKLENKRIILTGGLDVEKDRFRRWLDDVARKEDTRLCFITARSWEESYLNEIINTSDIATEIKQKSLFVEYEELPTAYISDKAQDDCFVIYTSEFEKLKDRLGITDDRHSAVIALKPAELKARREFELDGESYYHSALQVFSTKDIGWEKQEVYAEKKSLFLFTVLALSFYESESFITPYSKLDLWQRKKTHYITIRRNHHPYTFPLNAVLYELIYLISKLPVEEKPEKR